MIRYENQCCDCSVPAYPCVGDSCPLLRVPVYSCDDCGRDCRNLYEINGTQYCESCAKDYLDGLFGDLSIAEQSEVLGVEMDEID